MTAKDFMMRILSIDRQIDSKLEQVTRLRNKAMKANAIITDMPRGDSPSQQPMAEAVVRLIDLENEVTRDIDQLVELKATARIAIKALADPEQQLVLELRYLCCKSWDSVAEALDYCPSNIFRIHDLALKNLILPKD